MLRVFPITEFFHGPRGRTFSYGEKYRTPVWMRSLYEFFRVLRVIYVIDIRYMIHFFAMNPYIQRYFSFAHV